MSDIAKLWIVTRYIGVWILCCNRVTCLLNTDMLWESCDTTICGQRNLKIHCETNSKILINHVTSGLGHDFDEISFLNLRRMCMGMSNCDPSHTGFCNQHRGAKFNVSYTCVTEHTIDNVCDAKGRVLYNKSGFITSPSYPAETSYRNCKWKIVVPDDHYVHVFLHEVLPSSTTGKACSDGGLLFSTTNPCGVKFPTFRICSEANVDSTITACSDTEIWLPYSTQNMRFLLSYYVVRVPELRHVLIYNVDITCNVLAKESFIYRIQNATVEPGVPNVNETERVRPQKENTGDEVDYVMYIGLAVGLLVIIVIIIILAIYLRCRYLSRNERQEKKGTVSDSVSQTNGSDIQKRPLPETQGTTDHTSDSQAELQQSYSVVADDIARQPSPKQAQVLSPFSSPTYAEVEEYSEAGLKPKAPLAGKRSIDSSKRKLPAKPGEEQTSSIYSEIEDSDAKDTGTEKSIVSKNKKNQENIIPEYAFKKKFSEVSNIYAECEDVKKPDDDKPYIDMTHKKAEVSEYVPHIKRNKDKENLSKKSKVPDKAKKENIPYADIEVKSKSGEKELPKNVKRSTKDSVTSESDSDDEICIVENELYEPFESAKV